MMEEEAEVKSTIATAKTKAKLWSVRMAAAKIRQKQIAFDLDESWMNWTNLRVESQKFLNLAAAHSEIGEEIKKLQKMREDYSMKIKTTVALVKQEKKVMLKTMKEELVIVREALKLMKDALDRCDYAVGSTGNILLHRIKFLKLQGDYVELIDFADLSILGHICDHSRRFKGLVLKFRFGKSVEKGLLEVFGAAVSLLEKEEITMEKGRLYQLSVDEKGYHFSQLSVEEATNHGFEQQSTMAEAGAEAEAEALAIELERAKRKEQFRSELMKEFAEDAEKITLQQIERDSADFKRSWSMIRIASQKLPILSSACSAIKTDMVISKNDVAIYSLKIDDLGSEAYFNKLHLSTVEKNNASSVERLTKLLLIKEKELRSIKEKIREANCKLTFVADVLQQLNEWKVVVEAGIRGILKRIADKEASLIDSRGEAEEKLRIIESQLMAVEKNVSTMQDSLKLTLDAMGSCKTAITLIEQVYIHRLLMLKFDGYVELVDITDVNILQSICARSNGRGIVLKFCVVNDELLEIVATTINKEKFILKRDRLYELSVDENGTYNIFELSVEEAANYGFKRFHAGSYNAFDPETKKHTILYDDGIEILNLRKEEWKLFGDEQPLQKQEADHSSPFKELIKTTEKNTKRVAGPTKEQQQHVASSSKRSKFESHDVIKSEGNLLPGFHQFVTEPGKENCETNKCIGKK